METQYAIQHGPLYKFSEQHLVSCDYSNDGCGGGVPEYAYEFVSVNGNVLLTDYPYASTDQEACLGDQMSKLAYVDPNDPYESGNADE